MFRLKNYISAISKTQTSVATRYILQILLLVVFGLFITYQIVLVMLESIIVGLMDVYYEIGAGVLAIGLLILQGVIIQSFLSLLERYT